MNDRLIAKSTPIRLLFAPLALLAALGASFGQTPPELLTVTTASAGKPAQRSWADLKISDYEIRLLEKIEDRPELEGFHIAYKSEGLHITGVLARPRLRQGQKYPLLLLNHGSFNGVNAAFRAIAWELARRGYVVLASTYRGEENAEGRSEGQVELAKGEVVDVLQLARLGARLPYVDPERMGIMGQSHGGNITIAAIERMDRFKAAVAMVPVIFSAAPEHDYGGRAVLTKVSTTLGRKEYSEQELAEELRARDLRAAAGRIKTPLLLITTDKDAGYEGQKHFVELLKQQDIEHRFLAYPGLFHAFMTAPRGENRPAHWEQSRAEAWTETFAFLARNLKLAPSSPTPIGQQLLYPTADGLFIQGYFVKPAGKPPFPAVILLPGGNGGHPLENLKNLSAWPVPQALLKGGYALFVGTYRAANVGQRELDDAVAAFEFVKMLPEVDSQRVAYLGWSHGAYLSLMAATRVRPAAVVVGGAFLDVWNSLFSAQALAFQHPLQKLIGQSWRFLLEPLFGREPEKYRSMSVLHQAARIQTPLLMIIGSADLETSVDDSRKLREMLNNAGKICELLVYEGMPHGFYSPRPGSEMTKEAKDALEKTQAFLAKHLATPNASSRIEQLNLEAGAALPYHP